jgi:hypothetical protein
VPNGLLAGRPVEALQPWVAVSQKANASWSILKKGREYVDGPTQRGVPMEPAHLTPGGGTVLDCESDEGCMVVTCELCLVDLPQEAAITEEGVDYVAHFCGLECLKAWRSRSRLKPG